MGVHVLNLALSIGVSIEITAIVLFVPKHIKQAIFFCYMNRATVISLSLILVLDQDVQVDRIFYWIIVLSYETQCLVNNNTIGINRTILGWS